MALKDQLVVVGNLAVRKVPEAVRLEFGRTCAEVTSVSEALKYSFDPHSFKYLHASPRPLRYPQQPFSTRTAAAEE